MDFGSEDRLALQNLQIPDQIHEGSTNVTIPEWPLTALQNKDSQPVIQTLPLS